MFDKFAENVSKMFEKLADNLSNAFRRRPGASASASPSPGF
jgi:hypothetical protein